MASGRSYGLGDAEKVQECVIILHTIPKCIVTDELEEVFRRGCLAVELVKVKLLYEVAERERGNVTFDI